MSKGKKTPEQVPSAPSTASDRSVAGELHEQGMLGNQALQDQLSEEAGATGFAVSIDVVRDTALPLVDRATLALQLPPRDQPDLDRFVDILERSGLPAERRQILVDRLRTDHAVAEGVARAVERWFGADSQQMRGELVDTLDAVRAGLSEGALDAGGWRLPDGETVALSRGSLDGSVSGRAEALIGDLATSSATPGLAEVEGVGEALRGFCGAVHLVALWDEEEDEEVPDHYPDPIST